MGKLCWLTITSTTCLWSLVGGKPKQLDMTLPQVKFAYNMSQNHTTQLNSFEIVYGKNPSRVLKLMHVPCIE